MKRTLAWFVPLLLAATCYAADLPAHPLTLPEALALARQNNPSIRSASAHTQAVQAGEITARLRPNPVFTSANEDFNIFEPSKFDPANNQEFTDNMAWTLERGGKRKARIVDARLATEVAGASISDSQRQIELQVKQAFVGYLLAKGSLRLAEDNLREYGQVIEANRLRLTAGDISETEFDRIFVEQAQFQSDLLAARTAVLQARTQLAALLAISDPSMIDAQGDLIPPQLSQSVAQLQQLALEHRPDYIGAIRSVAKAEADVRLARANGATDVVVAPEYKRNGPNNTIGVTFSFQLRVFDRNQGEKLRTTREFEAGRYAQEASRLQVLADVQQAWDAYQAAVEKQRLYSEDYLKRSQTVLERMAFSYQHGATGLLEYLDAVRSHRQVSLGALTANAQVLFAIHQLSFASATELLP